MDKISRAIETLRLNQGILELDLSNGIKHRDHDEFKEMCDVALEALEKQAFFENKISVISDWFVDNKDEMIDSAMSVANNWFDDCNENGKIDKVDLDFMIEDIVDVMQKGILNVLSSYKIA